ncbi:hypothetical protein AALB52_09430 [Lachnospiraceae bacterium 38-14]|uniref:hypothetical protein n=1 Tax=Roseburia sp. 1XD42-69 TaxID=2320088 RepID=UPI000EA3ABD0|nr:hypothetical protein [Roseburia sp. 1XD42-69]RKJ66301.1 hypothetical protein D7Y06_07580 [Roseburia sp. 1XD42-69]
MRGTYRCTNVKFCMEDENQRRAWEYLHGLNRRDGSYGKVLADALIAVIGSQSNLQNAMRKRFSGKQCEDSGDEIKEFANKVAEVVLEGITDYFADKAVFQGTKQRLDETQVSKPEPEEEIAEDMLDFAFSMGE